MSERSGSVAVAVCSAVAALAYGLIAFQYERGSIAQPGPGFYPILIASVMLVGAAGVLGEQLPRIASAEVVWPRGRALVRVGSILTATCAYALFVAITGHAIGATVVSLVVLQVMSLRPAWLRLPVAILFGFGSFYLFTMLGVELPGGWLSLLVH